MQDKKQTIAAIATANGMGAIGIIRISGPEAISICNTVFKGPDLRTVNSHTIHYGFIVNNGTVLDEVMISVFHAPRSFTAENSVEISCHGSPYILESILQLLIRYGAKMAEPGEFTLRAFLNGRIDLSQAEAVADLIASNSTAAREIAIQQMRGGFASELKNLRTQLIDFTALIELELDFSEEDVAFADREDLIKNLNKIQSVLHDLASSFQYGNAIKNGVAVAIVGRPNAGKSSWINALTNDDVSIVSTIAGTTRDKVEAQLNIDGVLFRLIDTAGIRETTDEIERIGVARAKETIAKANIILHLFDSSTTNLERFTLENNDIKETNPNAPVVHLANKIDQLEKLPDWCNEQQNIYAVSVHQHTHIQNVKQLMLKEIHDLQNNESNYVVSNTRHYEALEQAKNDIKQVLNAFDAQLSSDLVAHSLRQAIHSIGSITGEVDIDEDILGTIFGKFCIGK